MAFVAGKAEAVGSGHRTDDGGLRGGGIVDRWDGDGRLADLMRESVGNIDVETGDVVADLGDLPDGDRVGSG